MDFTIREADQTDIPALLSIYAPYVTDTAITFEYEVPTEDEFSVRMQNTKKMYPYLVLCTDGKVTGYAYAGSFVGRKAYQWAAETTIYLSPFIQGYGAGRLLYTALEDALRRMGVLSAYACIARPIVPDETLTNQSISFHTHLGYRLAGEFHRCGYKFGRWYDMVWMEKDLGDKMDTPAPVVPFFTLG